MQPLPTSPLTGLGFGTSSLAKNNTTRAVLGNLETALECGITHFDTAPAYCFGHAEMLLGKFIRDKRDRVTVSTKYGITPRRIPWVLMPAFNLVRKPLKKLLASAVKASGSNHHHAFSYTTEIDPQALEDSLHNSLRELKTDYVDNFLLHQIDASLANREDVVAKLTALVDAGKVRRLGLAGSFSRIYGDEYPKEVYSAIQFDDHVHKEHARQIPEAPGGRQYFRFSVFSLLGKAKEFLTTDRALDGITPVALCLAYYKRDEDFGITLFSSSNNNNIRNAAATWVEHASLPPGVLANFATYVKQTTEAEV